MSRKAVLGRAALSFDTIDGILDTDQILNTTPWNEIDNFVQTNFLQDILDQFNEQMTLDPNRIPAEMKKASPKSGQRSGVKQTKKKNLEEMNNNELGPVDGAKPVAKKNAKTRATIKGGEAEGVNNTKQAKQMKEKRVIKRPRFRRVYVAKSDESEIVQESEEVSCSKAMEVVKVPMRERKSLDKGKQNSKETKTTRKQNSKETKTTRKQNSKESKTTRKQNSKETKKNTITENSLGAGSSSTENSLQTGSSSTENSLGAGSSSTENSLGAGSSSTENSLGAGSSSTENSLGAGSSSTENSLGARSSSTENSLRVGSSNTEDFLRIEITSAEGSIGVGNTIIEGSMRAGSTNRRKVNATRYDKFESSERLEKVLSSNAKKCLVKVPLRKGNRKNKGKEDSKETENTNAKDSVQAKITIVKDSVRPQSKSGEDCLNTEIVSSTMNGSEVLGYRSAMETSKNSKYVSQFETSTPKRENSSISDKKKSMKDHYNYYCSIWSLPQATNVVNNNNNNINNNNGTEVLPVTKEEKEEIITVNCKLENTTNKNDNIRKVKKETDKLMKKEKGLKGTKKSPPRKIRTERKIKDEKTQTGKKKIGKFEKRLRDKEEKRQKKKARSYEKKMIRATKAFSHQLITAVQRMSHLPGKNAKDLISRIGTCDFLPSSSTNDNSCSCSHSSFSSSSSRSYSYSSDSSCSCCSGSYSSSSYSSCSCSCKHHDYTDSSDSYTTDEYSEYTLDSSSN